jgi:uncharacterized membrane protein
MDRNPAHRALGEQVSRERLVITALYVFFCCAGAWNAVRGSETGLMAIFPYLYVVLAVVAFSLSYKTTVRNVAAASVVVVLFFFAELSGVHGGIPYGDYAYAASLGPKLFDVPVVIPLFWLTIILAAWSVADRILRFQHVIVAAVVVTAFDAVLEFAADSLGMWHWQGGMPTELTFISRFAMAYLGLTILKRYAMEKGTARILPHLLIAQLLFFVLSDAGIRFFPHA